MDSMSIDEPLVEDKVKQIPNRHRDSDENNQQILAQRVPLLRRLNHLHHTFPDEILCAIFEHACRADKNGNPLLSPLTLGAVCFRWRQVVWNSPSLWRIIGTIPSPRRPLRSSDVELLRLYFQNIGTHFASLKLRLLGLPRGRTTDELLQVFVENSAKIKWLLLSGTNLFETWVKLAAALRSCRFDNLHSLSLVGCEPINCWFNQLSFRAPHMRSVSFDGLNLSTRKFSLHLIQVLHLKNIAIDQCLETLAQAPALQEFYCSRTKFVQRHTIPDRALLTLHHLKVFDADLGFSFKHRETLETFFFTHFRFPKLEKLVWGISFSPELKETTWRPFFSAMDSVVDFTYRSQDRSMHELPEILQALGPSIRRIRVSSPAAQQEWQNVLNAIQLSMGRVPGYGSMWHIELFLPQQNPIFQQNHGEIKERMRGVGLELDIIGF